MSCNLKYNFLNSFIQLNFNKTLKKFNEYDLQKSVQIQFTWHKNVLLNKLSTFFLLNNNFKKCSSDYSFFGLLASVYACPCMIPSVRKSGSDTIHDTILWCYGTVTLWYYITMILWCYDTILPWYCDTMMS